MRELKFRGWNRIVGRMSDPVTIDKFPPNTQWQCLDLMQFTGLHDKDGKEIYEGDIVKTFWQYDGHINEDYELIGEVVYVENMAQYILDCPEEECWKSFYFEERHEYFPDQTEVIGNIHENPELLK